MLCLLLIPSLWQDALAANHSGLKAMHFLKKKQVSEIIINLFSSVMLKLHWKFELLRIDRNSSKEKGLSN